MPQRRPLFESRHVRDEFQLSALRAALLIALCAGMCLAQQRSVALTFDDLPIVGSGGAEEAARIPMDQVLQLFEEREYRFVTLDQAQADAAYRTPVAATSYGQMWGYRWASALGVKVDGRMEPNPPAWVTEYGKTGK